MYDMRLYAAVANVLTLAASVFSQISVQLDGFSGRPATVQSQYKSK